MRTSTSVRPSAPLWLALLIALLALFLLPGPRATPTPERDAVAQAWRLARESGSYDFQTVVNHQTLPQPSLRGAGRRPRHDYMTLQGSVDQPAKRMELSLWRSRSTDPVRALSLKVEDGRAMQRSGAGAWEPTELDTLSFAPGGDPLGFLASAGTIVAGPAETVRLGSLERRYATYTFVLEGARFGRYLDETLAPRLREQGRMPAWVRSGFAQAYADLGGSGTLWVDEEGLPARLALDVRLPAAEGQGASSATITSDFSRFDRSRLALASTTLTANPLGWLSYRLSLYQPARQAAALHALLALALAGLLVVCGRAWRSRRFYAAAVVLVIVSMLVTPLLQAGQVTAFAAGQQAAQAEQDALVDADQDLRDALDALREPGIDPHVGAGGGDAGGGAVREPPLHAIGTSFAATTATTASTDVTDDTDTDGDGLTDVDEEEWGSCPDDGSIDDACDGVADSTDSDADGISDGVEVFGSGTLPNDGDSDSDSISDTLELAGFSYAGQIWYLDPSESDTNKDDLIDSIECASWVPGDDFDPDAACPDTDADGTPDVWDDDNDGDGVHDSLDLSPGAGGGVTYSGDNPLTLSVDGLTPDEPVFVDLQLLPTDEEHLIYQGSVLDWPSGDTEGQITRRLSTTFADTENSEILSSDENAANGDLRLVPMLEIIIPYESGHYANLPVLDGAAGSRALGVEVDDWLDTTELEPYGITVRDGDLSTGELVAYVPLSAEEDETTGLRTSLAARMLYWPEQDDGQGAVDWGAAHEYRVIWLVQMIADECADEADLSTCEDTITIVHIYDETWELTGLTVREDHGAEAAILYEDPDQDTDTAEEDDLWAASWNLGNIWLRGRDCDSMVTGSCVSNGGRDVTIATMEAEIDEWSGNTDAIEAATFSYVHEDYLSHIAMTETVELLEAQFSGATAPVSETGLLFAYEQTYRTSDLESATLSGYAVGVPMDETTAPELVQASMSWSRYRYDESDGWANYDSAEDLERLALDVAEQEYFQDDEDGEAEAKIIWLQSYYSTLLTGVSSIVQVDGSLTWSESDGVEYLRENYYDPGWPSATFTGAGFAVDALINAVGVSIGLNKVSILSSTFQYTLSNPAMTSHFSKSLGGANLGSSILMSTVLMGTAVGLGLLAIGYFTGERALTTYGMMVLNVTTIVTSVAWSLNLIYGLYSSADQSFKALKAISANSRAVGVMGLIIGFVFTWGMYALTAYKSWKDPNSFEFNMRLAMAIAETLVQLLLFALDFVPIVGPLIVCIIYLIDAIMALACARCTGAQEWMSERFTEFLYDTDSIIDNMDDADRLDFQFAEMTLRDDEEGFTTANSVSYSMDITNTLRYKPNYHLRDWIEGIDEDAKQTTIRYTLERTPADHHDDLALGQMEDDWEAGFSVWDTYKEYDRIRMNASVVQQGGPISFGSVGSGINRSLSGKLYLTESYALPTQGCWLLLWNEVDCTLYPSNDSWSLDVGEYLVFDILPANLSDFYWLDWNDNGALDFPAQVDHDNDGLVVGTDPNDTSWDFDGDDMSDYYELIEGTNPSKSDSDADGLNDGAELRYGSDPLSGDVDEDGLSDAAEQEGWRTAYAVVDGTPQYTWVWSDPALSDADEDGLNDLEEFYYGFHPWVETDSDAILNTITFEDSAIEEQGAPQLLMRYEEDSGARVFADHSGQGLLAACADETSTTCPSASTGGRYGDALSFDGGDELDLGDGIVELGKGSFTIAAWIKTSGTSRAILTKGDGDASWEQGEKSLYLNASGRPTFVGWGNSYIYSSSAVNDGSWHHVAVTWAYTSGTSGTGTIYVDGVDVTNRSTTNYAANNADNAADSVRVGAANYGTEAPSSLLGSLDDLALYDAALSQAQVQALMDGDYDAGDYVVSPGAALDASLTINNNSASWPAAVTYYGEVDESFTGTTDVTPYARWKFDEGASATTFADATGNGRSGSCSGTTCPVRNATGYRGKALTMESGDIVKLDNGLGGSGFDYAFVMGLWIYPTGGSDRYQRVAGILNKESTSGDDLLDDIVYSTLDKKILAGYGLSSGDNSVPLNTWTHVMVVWDRVSNAQALYINGAVAGRSVLLDGADFDPKGKLLRLGDQITSNDGSVYPVGSFLGRVDDMVIYDQLLTDDEIDLVMTEQDPERQVEATTTQYTVAALGSQSLSSTFTIPASTAGGVFDYTQAAEASLDITDERGVNATPLTRAHFDEPFNSSTGFTLMYSTADNNNFTEMTCSSGTCPTQVADFAGSAVDLDGSDDTLAIASAISAAPWTVGVWFKPDADSASAKRAIFGNGGSGATSGFPGLYITTDKRLAMRIYTTGSGWQEYTPSSSTITLGIWQQVTVTYSGSGSFSIYLNGQLYGTVTATPANLSSTIYLGKIGTDYSTFKGLLDNFTVYNVALSASKVQLLASMPDLALHAHYSLDEPPGDSTFTDLAGVVGDASCSGTACPTLGTSGQVNRSALFEGADLVSSPNLGNFYRDRDTNITMAAWIKLRRGEIVEARGLQEPFAIWNNRVSGGKARTSIANRGYYEDSSSYAAPSTTEWSHIVVTNDTETSASKLYVDGQLSTNNLWASLSTSPDTSYPLWIGGEAYGYLDDIRFYQRDLSAADVLDLYETSSPVLQYAFEEDYDAASFADSSPNSYDAPIDGVQGGGSGRVGNGADFDGASAITLDGATEVDALSSNLTFMAWVKPDVLGGSQTIFSSYSSASKGFVLRLVGDQLQLTALPSASVTSAGSIAADSWSHVAVVVSEGGVATFYIDGAHAGSSTLGSASAITADSDGVAYVGAEPSGGGLGSYYSGKLDELALYARSYSAAEVLATYYEQFRWFRKETSAQVTVDTDAPTVSLVSDASYWPSDDLQLTVSTTDTTSAVWAFDYTLTGPDGVTRGGQSAEACSDSVDNSLWCLTLDPDALGGAGRYTLQFRAVDAVGNETTSGTYTLYVDGTAPTATSSYSNTWLSPVADADEELAWRVALSGTLSDPALSSSGGSVAGSGVDPESITVALVDSTGATLHSGPVTATLSGTTWSASYEISGKTPAGVFTVQVTAADALGNSATTSVGTVIFDEQEPSVDLTVSGLSYEIQTETTLRGVITDQPQPDGAVVAFHFAETSGGSAPAFSEATNATSFTGDPASTIFDAGCPLGGTSCPAATTGAFGNGLLFSAGSATQLTVAATYTLAVAEGTLSAWVRPTWTSGANGYSPAILALTNGTTTRYRWQLADNLGSVQIFNGSSTASVSASITRNVWTHLAIVQEGSSWTLYVNGVAAGSAEQAFGSTGLLPLYIGSAGGSQHFTGGLDEVMVFERALSAYEVYQLAQQTVAGVASQDVQISFLKLDLDDPLDGGPDDPDNVWLPATLQSTGVGQTSWSYALPSGLEGLYAINVRGNDDDDNQASGGTYWRGAIDTWNPRLTLSGAHVGGLLTGHTEFSYTIEDMFLDESTLTHSRCSSDDRVYTYDEDTGEIVRIDVSCQVAGIQYGSYYAQACDFAGHCSPSSRNPDTHDLSEAAIYSPSDGDVVEGTGAITINGEGYVQTGSLKEIVLKVDGSQIGSWSWAQNAFSRRAWSQSWTPPSPGTYTADLTVTSWTGAVLTDTHTFRVISAPVPGGVRDDLALWMDAGEDIAASGGVTLTDGLAVASWVDQAQGWTASNTSDQMPTYSGSALNFNPALTFGASGASELSFGANWIQAAPGSGGLSIFAVVDPAITSGDRMVLDAGRYAIAGYGLGASPTTALGYAPHNNSGTLADLISGTLPTGSAPALLGYAVELGSGGSLRANGALVSSASNTQRTRLDSANVQHSAAHASTTGPLTLGRQANNASPASYFQGQIAEVVAFTGTLSLAERRAVESYLAIKYGLTLGDATAPLSYTTSSGTVLWDATAQADFQRDVVGIGLDEASGLDQRMSLGVAGSSMLTIAHGELADPAALAADESFLLWGHDGGLATGFITTTQETVTYQRLARTWQARETGTVGAVELGFDLGGISPAPAQAWLAVSAQRTFGSATLVPGTIVGGEARFSVDLSDGQYFTLARSASDSVSVDLQGAGSGAVTSSPAGISCGAACQASFTYGATVTLTATPATGSSFGGWSGPCSGTGSCVVAAQELAEVVATFALKPYALNVQRSTGSGLGTVTSSPAGISCGSDCAEQLLFGTQITLSAAPHTGSSFVGWNGACSGTGSCVVTIDESNEVTALFSNPDGAPYGDVAWPIPGTIQAEHYNLGGEGVAYHDSDARQRGYGMRLGEGVDVLWPGDVDTSEAVGYTTAGEWLKYTVQIAQTGLYELQIRSASPSSDGSLALELDGVPIAGGIGVPNTGNHFVYATSSTSGVPLTAGEHVLTVSFERPPGNVNWFRFVRQERLDVALAGSGLGSVGSAHAGGAGGVISCGSTCVAGYAPGTVVTLTATAERGSSFTGWSGACSGTGSCVVSMSQAHSVMATFTAARYALTVTTINSGAGLGTVTSGPADINCGADCSEMLDYGTQVTLQASIANGTFVGWSGACSGQGDCVLTIDESNDVTATFIDMYEVTAQLGGGGAGSIVSSVPGISCGADCANLFTTGTIVTLQAVAGAGSYFTGWSGACSGMASTCQVTVDQSLLVQADFALNSYQLTAGFAGGGNGTLISNGGISCSGLPVSGSCVDTALHGQQIWLTAQEAPGSTFGGWSGACSGSETSCLVRLDQNLQVTAHFYGCNAIGVHNAAEGGRGSLRDAITQLCPGGTITFAGDFNIPVPGQIYITKGVTIDGAGHSITLNGDSEGIDERGGILKIETSSPVTLKNLTLTNGTARLGGALSSNAPLTIEDSTFTANRSTERQGALGGGAIFNDGGSMTIVDSSFSGNVAYGWGGAILSRNGTLSIEDSTISGNASSNKQGGGLALHDNTTTIADSVVRGNSGSYGGALLQYEGSLTIEETTFADNTALYYGGALQLDSGATTISASEIAGNVAGTGGGGLTSNFGTLTLVDSAVANNAAPLGGGVSVCDGTATISRSSITGNTSVKLNSMGSDGGGIYSCGGLTIENSTIAGNSTDARGGGLYVAWGETTLLNSTISGNRAKAGGGGGLAVSRQEGTLHVRNSIAANSLAGGDCAGPLSTNTNNLVEDGSCSPARSGDPLLGALGSYGELTEVMPPLPGSVAIDAGNAATCTATDQRGDGRVGARCDLGARESQGFKLVITGGDGQRALPGTAFTAPLALQLVANATGEPVRSGLVVRFTAPSSGASLSSASFTATTSATGQASASVKANGLYGTYKVKAVVAGLTSPVTFSLRNAPEPNRLSVSVQGEGLGTVSSSPAGISCGSSCSALFDVDATVTLTATPSDGSSFAGWGGACAGTGACQVTMGQARSVTASFTLDASALRVTVYGAGTVTSSPGGINCSRDCVAVFAPDTLVTLTASPSGGARFARWGGACAGTPGLSCQVTMSQARSVSAIFLRSTTLLPGVDN